MTDIDRTADPMRRSATLHPSSDGTGHTHGDGSPHPVVEGSGKRSLVTSENRGRTTRPRVPSRVLIADDERLIADTLAQILRACGHTVRVAYDGVEAIAAAQQQCPEIVLTDVLMPHVDGVQAAIWIRGHCPRARIILFSGQAITTDLLKEARVAGHDFEIWSKPLHPRELLSRLHG